MQNTCETGVIEDFSPREEQHSRKDGSDEQRAWQGSRNPGDSVGQNRQCRGKGVHFRVWGAEEEANRASVRPRGNRATLSRLSGPPILYIPAVKVPTCFHPSRDPAFHEDDAWRLPPSFHSPLPASFSFLDT